jgi:hypothetical protein
MQRGIMTLVEECAGVGELVSKDTPTQRVPYRISRYQGMLEGSGMPIPGLSKVEGQIDLSGVASANDLVGMPLTLRLEDGRSLPVMLADADGRVLTEGHGPGRGCACC